VVRWGLVPLGVGCLLGCAGAWNFANVDPFEAYAARLAGPDVVVVHCGMAGTTREGACELEGSEAALDAFLAAHGGAAVGGEALRGPCHDRYRFGSEVDGPAEVYRLDPERLPPNQDNVRVQHVVRVQGAVCVALEYPFG
jgi:hypothetical protein